jgi:uncharacterized membrane protein
MIESLFFVLALIGLLVSTHFTAVAYRWMRPDSRWVPPFCRLDEGICTLVVFTPQARLFGPPNSLLGQAYYSALLIGVWQGAALQRPWVFGYLAVAAVTVALALYLSYSLVYVLRIRCVLCFASHAINVGLFLLLLATL